MTPYFSILVAINEENAHLLPFTLESLAAQEEKNFECFLVPFGYTAKQKTDIDKRIPSLTIIDFEDLSFAQGLNLAIDKAHGTYVHILCAGEFYLSHRALQTFESYLKEKDEPELVYTGQILRSSFKEPEILMQRISRRDLMKVNIPQRLHAFWFSRQLLLKQGLFCTEFIFQSAFDLICRLILSPKITKHFFKKVIVDYDYQKEQPRILLRRYWETAIILWRYFGITFGLFQWVGHNYAVWFQWMVNGLRKAFIKKKIIIR